MHHKAADSVCVEGELVSKETACCDATTPAFERKNTSSSDNDATAALSTASSSHGSIQVLAEPNTEINEEASPGRRRSSRRKTESMLRGSLTARDFFGEERVSEDRDVSVSKPGQVQEEVHICPEDLFQTSEVIGVTSGEDTVMLTSVSGAQPSKVQEIKACQEITVANSSKVSPVITDQATSKKCQCIIL
jgi:hypothetical protein